MSSIRVLDANINRAAEGMRVLEDIARFVLEHQRLCAELKTCRHQLREQAPSLYSRNTSGDVGISVSTVQESERGSVHDIALAASNRCSEALRVIEEFLKLHDVQNHIESIRYKMYDISAEIIKSLGSIHKKQWKLCFVMTKELCALPWKETLSQALSNGCDCVQVREKTMSTKELIQHVLEVKEIADQFDVPVIINDRVDVLLATNASGVHLGSNDMSIEDARRICGKEPIIGVTVHSLVELNRAHIQGVDYVGVGAMFASNTKPEAKVVCEEVLTAALEQHHLAIGGIDIENVQVLHSKGCKGIAVCDAISRSSVPGLVVEALLQLEAQPA